MKKLTHTAAQVAVLMAILTLGSKFLGFIREMVMANYFGTSYVVDAYVMAQNIPAILFGGIFSAAHIAYMPLFSRKVEEDGERLGDIFTSKVINIVILLSIVTGAFGLLFAPNLVELLANGFEAKTATLTVFFLRVTFMYTMFTATTGILESYLQYKGTFLPQILAGYAQNIFVISIIAISAYTNCYYLAFGMFIGTACKYFLVFFIAKRKGYHYSLDIHFDGLVKEIMILTLPVFVANSIQQINTLVDKTLASNLQEGSVAALNYAMLIVTMITGVTTSIFSLIIYPKFSQAGASKNYERLNDIMLQSIIIVFMISFPCMLGILFYKDEVVGLIYERGAFDKNATVLTASAFMFYGFGLTSLALNEVFIRFYYAMKNMKLPMIFAGVGVMLNVLLAITLIGPMKQNGLALSTSCSFIIVTVLLIAGIIKKYEFVKLRSIMPKVVRVTIAATVSVATIYLIYTQISSRAADDFYIQAIELLIVVFVTGMIYIILLWMMKIDEIKIIRTIIRK